MLKKLGKFLDSHENVMVNVAYGFAAVIIAGTLIFNVLVATHVIEFVK
jgi:hypothetical protein